MCVCVCVRVRVDTCMCAFLNCGYSLVQKNSSLYTCTHVPGEDYQIRKGDCGSIAIKTYKFMYIRYRKCVRITGHNMICVN